MLEYFNSIQQATKSVNNPVNIQSTLTIFDDMLPCLKLTVTTLEHQEEINTHLTLLETEFYR
jgi:hypothetical protein